jgi:hypothetical protein
MHILLFIIYAVVLGWIIIRRPLLRDIRPGVLLAFFALRVTAGCLHTWVAWQYFPGHGDIWLFFNNSFNTRHLLFTDLHAFWADNSGLAYLAHNLIEWMHVLFNFLSLDNLYINTLFFIFLTLGGHIALFRVFYERFGNNALCAACMLLLPSILFWTSCVHTEGIIYAMLGWLLYTLHRSFTDRWTTSRIGRGILLTALIIFFRPAIAVGLLPALGIWIAVENKVRLRTILLMMAALIALIICLSFLSHYSLPRALSARQQEFRSMTGNSRIALPSLEPAWSSLLKVLPAALYNGFFQPLPGTGGQKIYLAFSIELMAIWVIVILAALRSFPWRWPAGLSILCLILALAGMLLIGYIIPFAGAIVRYRSIYLPFLLATGVAAFRTLPAVQKLDTILKEQFFK